MKILSGSELSTIANHPKCAATVGSFDGVHRGHQILIQKTIDTAHERGVESMAITFEPHPAIALGKSHKVELLTTLDEKIEIFQRLGIDTLTIIPFDHKFSQLSPLEYIHYLQTRLGVGWLIVGFDHHFGAQKQGDGTLLEQHRESLQTIQIEQQSMDGAKISSTLIRAAIRNGEIGKANQLLGYDYPIACNTKGCEVTIDDRHKLLPPDGKYRAMVCGTPTTLTINQGKCTLHQEVTATTTTIKLLE